MRPKSVPAICFEWLEDEDGFSGIILKHRRAKYKAVSRLLDKNPPT